MGAVNLGITYGRRDLADTPRVFVQNLIVEPNATNEVDGKTWILRPGTATFDAPLGTGVRGLFPGPNRSQFYILKDQSLYLESQFGDSWTFLGQVPGVQYAQFAESPTVLCIVSDGKAYGYNGTAVKQIVMPGGAQVGWCEYASGFFLFGVAFSQLVYFMPPTSTAPDALDFFSIETHANDTVRAVANADQVMFFTTGNTEIWQASGNADLPFNRIVGAGFERGLITKYGITKADGTIFFVGDDLKVYSLTNTPTPVSDNSIEERLRVAFSNYSKGDKLPVFMMWTLLLDGHTYLILTIDSQGTWALDTTTGAWLSWLDVGSLTWRAEYGVSLNGFLTVAGNLTQDALYRVSGEVVDQDGIPWMLTGGVPIAGPAQRLDDLVLFTNAGFGGSLTAPVAVDLEISNDQGATFTDPILAIGGAPGDFTADPLWQMLGDMRQPQCVLRFSGLALDPFRISYCRYNEYSG